VQGASHGVERACNAAKQDTCQAGVSWFEQQGQQEPLLVVRRTNKA
jgi:hypothetical protein